METRKVYRSGGSTFVISLPKRWVNKTGIKEGNSVIVSEIEGLLTIRAGEIESRSQKAIIDSEKLGSLDDIKLLIISHYLVGYNEIVVRFNKENRLLYKKEIRDVIGFLMGLEIAEEHENYLLLEVILDQEKISTQQALKRMYLIIKSMLKDALEAMESGNAEIIEDIITREKEIDRLYFLVVRQLKSAVRFSQTALKLGILEQREALGYRIVVKSFERISDHIENLVKNFMELISKTMDFTEAKNLTVVVLDLLDDSAKSLFGKDEKKALAIFQSLNEVKEHHAKASKLVSSKKLNLQAAINYKAMIDSLQRIAEYSSDIAEIAINMSVKMP